jgi:hypothetical protein
MFYVDGFLVAALPLTGEPPESAAPVDAAPRDSIPFVASRSELGTPVEWVRFRLRATVDKDTCPTCLTQNALMYQCRAGETPPPITHCTHVRDRHSERMCRCVWEPAPSAKEERAARVRKLFESGRITIDPSDAAEAPSPWRLTDADVEALRKLVDVADDMTELCADERAVHPEDFAEERAVVKAGAELLARIDAAAKR